MDITVTWDMVAWVIGLVMAWTGFLIGIIQWLIKRMAGNLDARLSEQAALWQKTDSDLKKLMVDLPLYYQRREDAIREYTNINFKLDRMYELRVNELMAERKQK